MFRRIGRDGPLDSYADFTSVTSKTERLFMFYILLLFFVDDDEVDLDKKVSKKAKQGEVKG